MSSGPFPGSAEDKGSRIYPRGRLPQRPVLHPEGFGSSMAKLLIPLLAPLILMLFIVPTGYLLEGPGPSFDLQEDLTVTGAKTYPSQGELMLTAVSLQESRLAYHLVAFFSDSFDLLKVRDYLGEELDTEEQDVVDIVITFLSQDTAVVAGLRELGMPVEVRMMGELVVGVAPGYPASGAIDPGEVIVGVNGDPLDSPERLSEAITSSRDGEAVTLQVKSIDKDLALELNERAMEEDAERPDLSTLLEEGVREVEIQPVYVPELDQRLIGVSTRDFFTYTSDVEVEWELETVKGPSAGMMMTLSLVNALTPEDLTGGGKIAGTGEITIEGDVQPIGGLPFKIRAAESEGALAFIYPVENQEDLAGFRTTLELYAVDDLDDALEALQAAR
ncbi:MAG: PDZ domain-containing protein [Actinomycetota bacterium]|nr:PDZ domain-containing protein [Actinomycetota bacterium]